MVFLELFYTFFIIGLFGFGGGYGMLSLIQTQTVVQHHWLSSAEFTNIVAISQMTPGPIGINAATYCGYVAVQNAGMGTPLAVLGSVVATLALVLPSFILMVLISKMFMKYMDTKPVQSIFAAVDDDRQFWFALAQSVAVWCEPLSLCRHFCGYEVPPHPSHPDDGLCCHRRSAPAV